MNQDAAVTHEREGRVAYVTLNRPPLHVLNLDALRALDEALAWAAKPDPSGRRTEDAQPPALLVLRARGGKCFCAGVDVADHTPEKIPAMLDLFHGALWRLHTMPCATVAVLHGPALGGGAELAMVCDFLVASEKASFGFPEIKVGCFPPVAMALLAAAAGPHHAAQMILTGEPLAASTAADWGLVNAVAAPEMLDAEAKALCDMLLEKSPAVLGLTARGLRKMRDGVFANSLREAEILYKQELVKLPDMEEGIRAFLEKRPPQWKG